MQTLVGEMHIFFRLWPGDGKQKVARLWVERAWLMFFCLSCAMKTVQGDCKIEGKDILFIENKVNVSCLDRGA